MINCLQVRTGKRSEPHTPKQNKVMKLDKVVIVNEAGEEGKIDRADYIKHMVKEHKVTDYTPDEEGSPTTPADKVVAHLLRAQEEGKDPDDGVKSKYGELATLIEEDYKRSVKAKECAKAEKEAEKAKKEEDKKNREAEEKVKKEKLALDQADFVGAFVTGADTAAEEFKAELETLASSLPDGVTVAKSGGGYGLVFDKDATKETVGKTLGYLQGKGANSSFIGNQIMFWVGDAISAATALGIYATAKEAGQHIAKFLSESTGKTVEPLSLDQYKRMAERTPAEYRNPKADPTAYLAISTAKAPRKEEKEKEEDFKKRLNAFESDRAELQKKLAVGELVKRKEIVPLVNELLIKHGMKDAPDPNKVVISLTEQLGAFFHATFALEELLDVHAEGVVKYKKGEEIITVTKDELETIRDTAKGHILNMMYRSEKLAIEPKDYIRGYIMKKAMVTIGKDADDKDIKQEENVKNFVYPLPFWKQEEAEPEEKAEVPAETPAREAAAEPAKKSKK
jgi:hypothetical protein